MDIEMLRDYCLSLTGTTEDLKWGEHLCFMIAEKIFVLSSLDDGTACFKCDPEDFDALVALQGVQQAPHFAKRQWVMVMSLDVLPEREFKECIKKSRALVKQKLPKKLQVLYEEN